MAWTDAKAAIKTKLEAISITSPITQTIERVMDNPEGQLDPSDTPVFILFPPSGTTEHVPGGWRRVQYTYRTRLMVHDAEVSRASELVEAYIDAVLRAWDDTSDLRGSGVQMVRPPRWEEPGMFEYGARKFVGVDIMFDITMGEAATFG